MEMTWITVPVTIEERESLRAKAHQELRSPRDQARLLLRQALGLATSNQSNQMHNRAGEVLADSSAVAA